MNAKATAERSNQPSTAVRVVTEGVLLAAASAFAYALAYFYESHYAETFGIPYQLISLSIPTILIAATAVISFSYLALIMLDSIINLVPKSASEEVLLFLGLLVLGFIFSLAYDLSVKETLILLGVIVLLSGLNLLPNLLDRRRGEKNPKESEPSRPPNLIFNLLADKLGLTLGIALLLGYMALLLAGALGHRAAKRQTDFFVLDNASNQVVLQIYGDTVISAPFDPCTNEILAPLTIQKVSDVSTLRLSKVKLEPLTLRKALSESAESVDDFMN